MKKWWLLLMLAWGTGSLFPASGEGLARRIGLFADAGETLFVERGTFSDFAPFHLDLGLQVPLNRAVSLEALFGFHPQNSFTIWPGWGGSLCAVFRREARPGLTLFAKGGVGAMVCDDGDGDYVTYRGFVAGGGLERLMGKRWGFRAGATGQFMFARYGRNAVWIDLYAGLFWRL